MALWPFKRRENPGAGGTTLFFASDLHGSEICFRKFLNAAKFYEADLLVLGGDIAGKLVLPIVEEAGGRFRATLHGEPRLLEIAYAYEQAMPRLPLPKHTPALRGEKIRY